MGRGLERRGITNIQSGASNFGEDIHRAEGVHGELAKERKGDVRGMACTFVRLVWIVVVVRR